MAVQTQLAPFWDELHADATVAMTGAAASGWGAPCCVASHSCSVVGSFSMGGEAGVALIVLPSCWAKGREAEIVGFRIF